MDSSKVEAQFVMPNMLKSGLIIEQGIDVEVFTAYRFISANNAHGSELDFQLMDCMF